MATRTEGLLAAQVKALCAVLRDRSVSLSLRDDAAIDLGILADPSATSALACVATDPTESDVIAETAGEALAETWLRHGTFDFGIYSRLTPAAQREAAALIKQHHPEWLANGLLVAG